MWLSCAPHVSSSMFMWSFFVSSEGMNEWSIVLCVFVCFFVCLCYFCMSLELLPGSYHDSEVSYFPI